MNKFLVKFASAAATAVIAVNGASAPALATGPSSANPSATTNPAATANKATGPIGQVLTVDAATNLSDGQILTVTGKGYDLQTGIYVTFCVIPPKGKRPELCGPFDVTGKNNQAVWVSSNPPIYAIPLVKPFTPVNTRVTSGKLKGKTVTTGSFKVQVPATQMIGSYDCKVVKCAILTRADHTLSDYRKADVIIPVTFK